MTFFLSKKELFKLKKQSNQQNLKLISANLSGNNGFILLLNFSNSKIFKLVQQNFLKLLFNFSDQQKYAGATFLGNSNLYRRFFLSNNNNNKSSSVVFLFYFVNDFNLFLFFDLLLRSKLHFYIIKIFNFETKEFVSVFDLVQLFGKKLYISKVKKQQESIKNLCFNFFYGFIFKLLFFLKNVGNKKSIF